LRLVPLLKQVRHDPLELSAIATYGLALAPKVGQGQRLAHGSPSTTRASYGRAREALKRTSP
jgi:hypothetical protein